MHFLLPLLNYIKKILLNVFTKRSYDALGEFSKDAMLISCMHFMDPFNFDEDRVKKCIIHYAKGRLLKKPRYPFVFRYHTEPAFSMVSFERRTFKQQEIKVV